MGHNTRKDVTTVQVYLTSIQKKKLKHLKKVKGGTYTGILNTLIDKEFEAVTADKELNFVK